MSTTEFTSFHRGGSGTPLVLLHGFTDTWRSWELVLPELEKHFDVYAPTLVGHAGGPPTPDNPTIDSLLDAIEAGMDEQGFEKAHIVGNSLGGYLALYLAARGRAESVVAFAPAGGWAEGDDSYLTTLETFINIKAMIMGALDHVDAMVASPEGRRAATQLITVNYEHLTPELVASQVRSVAGCDVDPFVAYIRESGWSLDDAGKIDVPVRIVWGSSDFILPMGVADPRFRDWLPNAEFVTLQGVGHLPQLDVPEATVAQILSATEA